MAADNIAVMANGQIVEQGTHAELVERDGLYAAMVRAQDLGTGAEQEGKVEKEEDGLGKGNTLRPHHSTTPSFARTRSESKIGDLGTGVEPLTRGTLNYSLFKCVWIMLKENRQLYPWYALIGLAYLMLSGTYPAQALLFSRLIEVFTLASAAEAHRQADFYALMLFVVALANLAGYFCVGLASNAIGQALTYRYRKEMLQQMLRMDQPFFDFSENASGSLTAKLSSAPAATQELMAQNLGLMLNVAGNVVASSVLGIAYGWKLGLTLVVTGLALIVGSGYVRIRLDQRLETLTEKQFSGSARLAAEAVASMRTVSLLTLESAVLREYSECLDGIVTRVARSSVSGRKRCGDE